MKLKNKGGQMHIQKVVDFRKKIFSKMERENNDRIWLRSSLKDIKRVVLINSAPRCGSSMLFSVLKKIPDIYSLHGETVPFYKLNGFSPDVSLSNQMSDEGVNFEGDNESLSRDVLSDLHVEGNDNSIIINDIALDQYIDDLMLRFSIQWPTIDFDYDRFRRAATHVFDVSSQGGNEFEKEKFYLELIKLLRNDYNAINPYYYDIPYDMVKMTFPDVEVPEGPPNHSIMLEEPPFILLLPHRKVETADFTDKILLLKTSVDCYRMNFIERMFPHADIKVIYLTRNPLASINGLYDGWIHRGFFSHNLAGFFESNRSNTKGLKIKGYSDIYEWGKWWWNYDLTPGWYNYIERRLEEVCAFQWCTSNKTIQEYKHTSKIAHCHVTYEDMVLDFKSRLSTFEKILDFIDVDTNIIQTLDLNELPVVQVTQPPRPYRWKERREILVPLLDSPEVSEMYTQLGYNKKNIEEWL